MEWLPTLFYEFEVSYWSLHDSWVRVWSSSTRVLCEKWDSQPKHAFYCQNTYLKWHFYRLSQNTYSRRRFDTGHGVFSFFFSFSMQNAYEWLCNVIIWWNDMKCNLDLDFDYNLIILFLILLRIWAIILMWNWLNRMSKSHIYTRLVVAN